MDSNDFVECGKQVLEYIAKLKEDISSYSVLPDVKPGFLRQAFSEEAPTKGENFTKIMEDFRKHIMPGITHWQHPNFHAYFPTGKSFSSHLGGLLADGIGCIGFTWFSSPSCTELEVLCLDWLVKAMGLPKSFLSTSETGGGVIQASASISTTIALLCARSRYINQYFDAAVTPSNIERASLVGRMVVYASDQAHCSVKKAANSCLLNMRLLDSGDNHVIDGEILSKAVAEDVAAGLIPLICVATLGTTTSCKFDHLDSLGSVCQAKNLWLHVDAAYAGSGLLCPEYRHWICGIEKVDSFNFNAHKLLFTDFSCSPMFFKDKKFIVDTFQQEAEYLKDHITKSLPDYRDWQLSLGRQFRSLKLWFVLRTYGIENLQKAIRRHVQMAHYFHDLLLQDERFEIVDMEFGLVTFRVKDDNAMTEKLLRRLTLERKIFLVGARYVKQNKFFLRFYGNHDVKDEDIQLSFKLIQQGLSNLLDEKNK